MYISIVVPCYNEERNIEAFYQAINELRLKSSYEIIYVNDGSRDKTLSTLQVLAGKDNRVKYVSFSRNFGKEAAMLAGLEMAKGEAVILMDGDLQHPPSLIPKMLDRYEEGYDQVIAKRTRTGDSWPRSIASKLYYRMMNRLIDVKLTDGVGDFRLLSRAAINSLLSLKEYNRFSKGLFSWIGFKEYIIEYDNVLRTEGESGWSISSLFNYGVDGILSFNNKPLRASLFAGIAVTALAFMFILIMLIQILITGIDEPGYFTIIASISMLGGLQLISLGIIGEYIGRIYYEVKGRPKYIVEESNLQPNYSMEEVKHHEEHFKE